MVPKLQACSILFMRNSNEYCLVYVWVLYICPYSCVCKRFALFNHQADAQILLLFIALCLYRSYLQHLAIVWVVRTFQSGKIIKSSSTTVQAFLKKKKKAKVKPQHFFLLDFFFFNWRHTWKCVIVFAHNSVTSPIVVPLRSEGKNSEVLIFSGLYLPHI